MSNRSWSSRKLCALVVATSLWLGQGCGGLEGIVARRALSRLAWRCYDRSMKITDDYRAKIRLWAEHQRVVALPVGPPLPKFSAQRFRSHQEMNRWKHELLLELARRVAAHG